jgi:hypothetical protein
VKYLYFASITLSLVLSGCGKSDTATVEEVLQNIPTLSQEIICAYDESNITYGDELIQLLKSTSKDWRTAEGIRKIDFFGDSDPGDFPTSEKTKNIYKACEVIFLKNPELKERVESRINKNKELMARKEAAERQELEEQYRKIEPLLTFWNNKASNEGQGDIADYLWATSQAERLIESGAQYSLTGSSREVESATCWATDRSFWSRGEPDGWWNCGIDFLGGDLEFFSIEFSGTSWSGTPDGGVRAGRDLDWQIPDELEVWLRQNKKVP